MYLYSQGEFTKQSHKAIPEGHFEEEQGRRGFFGSVSHLIKPQPSTRWEVIEGPLRPHLYDSPAMNKLWGVWQRMLFNQDCSLYQYFDKPNQLEISYGFRNADGETLYFCHQGKGNILTEYGLLPFEVGHYILIPKCVTHTFVFEEESQFLVIESRTGAYREPDRGMLGKNAIYDPTSFGKPNLEGQINFKKEKNINITSIVVKRENRMTTFQYSSCYYDTLGWKGDFYPLTLHVRDIMPILSARVHLPPSAHTTFVSSQFVVCTFLPRPLESDPDALKVPFYHQNIDYDEVIFYHAGNFFSRDNLKAGMISFHPAGFPHGPHPKAVKSIDSKTHTDEIAVMVDTWGALQVDPEFAKLEVSEYWASWKTR